MTALPMTLEDTLRYQGYSIDVAEQSELTITLPEGSIVVPAMVRSALVWRRSPAVPELGDDLYLGNIPIFDDTYRPVILSHILDRYRTRRLGYDTPGQWMLAFRRWANLSMPLFNRRYVSTAVELPLDDRNETDATEATSHGLDIGSDFPQSIIGANTDYASAATDRRTADNSTLRRTGRSTSVMALLEQQRAAFLNVDAEIVDGLEPLFLGVYDAGEGVRPDGDYGYPWSNLHPLRRWGW